MLASFPKISIVTPNYNQAAFLEQTILSVLSQGYPNLEYIVIDGGSTDGSLEIIRKYEQQLAYWVSEKDNGLYDALQKGFGKSTGDIMAWINSDDLYHRQSFSAVASMFAQFPQARWIMGSNSYFDEEGNCFTYERDIFDERWSSWRMQLYNGAFIQQESVFWKRELWEEAGAYISQEYPLAADFELWLRFFRYDQLYSSSFLLAGFRMRKSGQLSDKFRKEYLEQVDALLARERKERKMTMYLLLCRLIMALTYVLTRKLRRKILSAALKLPAKIVFDRGKGFVMRRK
ncbi:glycosyltransferase [Terrimonas sp. NA20]|uniref:Glycosyltransferase n=1 Tax=Terrimonas ginsenosidimutans TaxID=2908004 RepID=A0ABS9KM81_9BACT|nr:glycosyltransferase family 2 protein [Terrimonas ginsenosidimutans]MCG2613430.1 glycosyltransferase [Terrimonas ginsenosidimutans]